MKLFLERCQAKILPERNNTFLRSLAQSPTEKRLSDLESATMYKKLGSECKIVWKNMNKNCRNTLGCKMSNKQNRGMILNSHPATTQNLCGNNKEMIFLQCTIQVQQRRKISCGKFLTADGIKFHFDIKLSHF